MKKHWIAITIVYMALLLLVSLRPAVETTAPPSVLKQAAHNSLHIPAYAILIFLLFNSLPFDALAEGQRSTACPPRLGRRVHSPQLSTIDRGLWTCFFIAVIYGALMEYLQVFSPGRLPSALDIILNTLGAGGMMFWLRKRRKELS